MGFANAKISAVCGIALAVSAAAAHAQTADVQIIHNSPDPGAEVVDIYLGTTKAIDDLAFREATGILQLDAGVQLDIGIAPGNSSSSADVIATFPVTLDAGNSYVVMAAGVLDTNLPNNPEGVDEAFALQVTAGLRSAGTGGNVDLLAFHGSVDAPTVDIVVSGNGALFEGLQFTDFSPDYVSVPASSYILNVTPAGDPATVVARFAADVSTLGGGAAVVFASGFLSPSAPAGTGFGLFAALTDGTVIPLPMAVVETADVQIIHNSPDPGAALVDIYIGTTMAVDDLAFRAATGIVQLDAGIQLDIGVAPGNSTSVSDVIATFPVTLTAGERYVVMAAGVLDNSLPGNPEGVDTSFDLYIYQGLRDMSSGGVDIIAFHGSPDAPTVDVIAAGVGPLFESLQFNDFAPDYITVPAATYTLQVTPAGNPTPVASFSADISGLDGGAAIVFASGFLSMSAPTGTEFGLFAALPNGAVVELPPVSTSVERTSWSGMKQLYR